MKKRMMRVVSALLALVMVLGLTACGGGGSKVKVPDELKRMYMPVLMHRATKC